MSLDRFVRFDKKKPTVDELKHILEDYIKDLGSISYSSNESVWFVKLPGKPSFPFKTIYPEMGHQVHEERWFEVWVGALDVANNIDVLTRQADELTNVIAEGYAKIVARFFEAEIEK